MLSRLLSIRESTLEETIERYVQKLYPRLNVRRNPFTARVNGIKTQVFHGGSPDHRFAIYQCFYKEQYELPKPLFEAEHHRAALQSRHRDIIASGGTPLIVDCGANIGASAVWFAARYPRCRVIAIEPAPGNVAFLRRNAENRPIDVLEAAIGPTDGSAFLDGTTTSALAHRVVTDGRGPPVATVSLETVLKNTAADPFILKIDIEGAEKSLFDNGQEMLDRFPLIVIEPHDFCMPGESIMASFFRYHADRGRDFLFANENVFSVDYRALKSA